MRSLEQVISGAELARIMKEQEGYCQSGLPCMIRKNAQTIADELGCAVETDLDELYSREDVDAKVIVASPITFTKEPVIKAAEHGVHVFCEKAHCPFPFKDCAEMVEACDRHQVTFYGGPCDELLSRCAHSEEDD